MGEGSWRSIVSVDMDASTAEITEYQVPSMAMKRRPVDVPRCRKEVPELYAN